MVQCPRKTVTCDCRGEKQNVLKRQKLYERKQIYLTTYLHHSQNGDGHVTDVNESRRSQVGIIELVQVKDKHLPDLESIQDTRYLHLLVLSCTPRTSFRKEVYV